MNGFETGLMVLSMTVFAIGALLLPRTPLAKYIIALGVAIYAAAAYVLHLSFSPRQHD
jgi:multisubunit Na+/H+ antiporter MnhC subunit